MTVKELIKELLDCPMEAIVQMEVLTEPDYNFSTDLVDSVEVINEHQVVIV